MKGEEELCQKEEGNLKREASEAEKNIRRTINGMGILACACPIPASMFKPMLTFWYILHVDLWAPELPARLNYLQHSSATANGSALSGSIFPH